jgi:hypothetical protein
MEAAFDSRS